MAELVPDPGPERMVARRDLRISDEDRTHVLDELQEHFAAGRLDLAEFEHRVNAVVVARYRGEVSPLLDDLPEIRPPEPAGPPLRERRKAASVFASEAFRIHTYVVLAVSAFLLAIYFGVTLVADTGDVPFWPIFPISVLGLTVGLHAAVRKGIDGPER